MPQRELATSIGRNAYAADLIPRRPGPPSTRTPVIKLSSAKARMESMPGPDTYTPYHLGKPSSSAWTMGDRAARRSAVETIGDSPGPVYQMRSTVGVQITSNQPSSPRFAFGTQARLGGGPDKGQNISPGPGAYSPRVSKKGGQAAMHDTTGLVQQGSVQLAQGTWSRSVDRSLASVNEGPGPTHHSPMIGFTKYKAPSYTMRSLGERQGIDIAGAKDSPGPSAYHPTVKSRFGGGHIGDAPSFSITDKDKNNNKFISKTHSRVLMGQHSPAPGAYTPLEAFGVNTYTVSNTSNHAPMFSFGSEARPCSTHA